MTDAYGASDIATKLIDVNGGNTILVNFCNAGLLPGTMNVNLQGYKPFSIDHEFPASGDNYDPHTCGCHSIELPIGQTIPITVSGGGSYQGETYTFSPIQALINISSSTQYFSTRSVNFVNGEVIVTLSSGIAFANRCSDVYTYP